MTVQFVLRTELPVPPQRAFDVSRSIDAHVDSMAHSRERAVGGVTAGLIEFGETVTWRAVHFGIPFTMTSAITAMQAPDTFTDEQVNGPFRRFHHEHRFLATSDGTTMIDTVTFEAPFGLLGRVAEKVLLARYLRSLIVRRNAHLVEAAALPH